MSWGLMTAWNTAILEALEEVPLMTNGGLNLLHPAGKRNEAEYTSCLDAFNSGTTT